MGGSFPSGQERLKSTCLLRARDVKRRCNPVSACDPNFDIAGVMWLQVLTELVGRLGGGVSLVKAVSEWLNNNKSARVGSKSWQFLYEYVPVLTLWSHSCVI